MRATRKPGRSISDRLGNLGGLRRRNSRAGAQANSSLLCPPPRERMPTRAIDVTPHENPPRWSYDKAVLGKLGISSSKTKPQRPTLAADMAPLESRAPGASLKS